MVQEKSKTARVNILKGQIAERYVELVLKDMGYKVSKVAELNRKKKEFFLHSRRIEEFLKKAKIRNAFFIINKLKENYKNGLPDFICRKGKQIKFVEVKSNKSGLDELQKKSFDMLRTLGFPVNLVRVKLDLDLKIMDKEEAKQIELEHQSEGYAYDLEGLNEL
jgi:hypothetical protein